MRPLAVLSCLLVLAASARAGEGVEIRVDAEGRRQKIAGFGGTVGWIYPQEKKLDEVADLLFTDLGASILRVSALSMNGDATDEGSPERVNDDANPEHINWRGFQFEPCEDEQARIAAAARKRGVRTLVAASWSPPGWMKTGGSRKWGGGLRRGMDAELAELWSAYLLWMRGKRKLEVTALSIQNEPEVPRPYPTAEFSAEELDRAARALVARARREKLKPRLLYPEVSQLGRLRPYLRAASRETMSAVGAISVHGYSLSVNYYEIERYRRMWRETRALVAPYRKPLWMTEFSNYSGALSGQDQGSWREALAWARHVHLALAEGECSAVLFWGLYFDKKGEALVYAKENKAEEYEITPKFYTSKNWFRFVRPGAVRLRCTPREGALECSAFWHGKRRELTVVVINPGDKEVLASLRTDGLGIPERAAMHRTSRTEKCVELDPRRQQVDARRLLFPAESVTTLLFTYGKQP